jgi:hypothetical protein
MDARNPPSQRKADAMTEAAPGPAAPAPASGDGESIAGERIRLRAVLLGTLLALLICLLTPFNNAYLKGTPLGGGQFPLAPFYLLVWMMLFTAGLQRVFKGRRLLSGRELLVMWALMVLLSGIAWTGLARTFFINLTAPYHFATVENHWEDLLQPLLPKGWYPTSREAVDGFYNGISGGRQMDWLEVVRRIPWGTWAGPLLEWTGFILLCYFLMISIVSLLSRQGLYNERMNFPLLRVPIMMQEAFDEDRLGAFLTHRFLIAGLMVPVCLHLINGLSFYNPSIPSIPTLILAGKFFPKTGLFSGFYKLKIYIYPAFIGFAFLTAKQVSFSLWFFFLAGALLVGLLNVLGINIPAAALGVTFGGTLSRPEETQAIGAYLVFFLFLAWLARFHFLDILLKAFGRRKETDPKAEWITSAPAFWGVVAGGIGLVAWCHHYGLPVGAAVLVLIAFFLFTLVAVRVICQGGITYFTLTAAPLDAVTAFFGSRFLTQAGLVVAAVTQKVLFMDLRESLMPALLHARKVTDGARNNHMVVGAIALALVAGVAASFVAMLAVAHKFGLRELDMDWATRTTVAVYENVFSLLESPAEPSRWVLIFTACGAAVMLALVVCYHRFFWWPIHPIGYLTAYSSAMWTLWFSFFLGWVCNALCMRYGGTALFRNLRFFFIGMIIGDFFMAGNWAIYGLFSYASYSVLPD